jgi:hypothetical protein
MMKSDFKGVVKLRKGFCFFLFGFLGMISLAVTILPTTSYACKCLEPQSVEKEMEHATAVFSGKIIGERNQKTQQKILFEVKETWKGVTETQVILVTDFSDCNVNFYQEQEYLVYASEVNGELTSESCSRTIELSGAEEDLATLGKGDAPTDEVNLKSELSPFAIYKNMWIPVIGVVVGGILLVWWQQRKNKN